jgi:molybdopterin-guanine dinucleotide biosynthesis protein A
MGQDKSLLRYQGFSLIEWQCRRFEQAGFQVISQLTDRFSGFLGPLAGIDAALHARPKVKHWVVVPVDMPKLSVTAVEDLFVQGEALMVPVAYDQAPMPLYLPTTPQLSSTLNCWLKDESGKRSVYALLTSLNGRWLPNTEKREELENYNTPEEWQAALAN